MPSLTAEQQAAWSETMRPTIMGICILFLVLGNLSVPMRIWAKWRIHKRPLAEDYSLILALVFANVVTVATLVSSTHGLGLHIWRVEAQDPSLQDLVKIFTAVWLTAVFNGPALVATKISLLLYYRRLFMVHQTWLRIAWWFNMVFVILWGIFCMLFYILQCTPPSYYWERLDPTKTVEDGKCPIPDKLHYVAIPLILSAVSDFAILLLPIFTVFTLQTAMARKLGLAAVFSVGFLAFACAIARIVVLLVVTNTSDDKTWNVVSFEVLNVVELNLAVLCASAIPIASRIKMMFGKKTESAYAYQMNSSTFRNRLPARLKSDGTNSTEHLQHGHSMSHCEARDDARWDEENDRIMVKVDVAVDQSRPAH